MINFSKKLFVTSVIVFASLLSVYPTMASELSQSTAQRVQRAHTYSLDGELSKAIELLESISTKREYDQAFVARMLGVFYWQNEQVEAAISQLKYAVESGLLADEQSVDTTRMLADLYLSNVQYKEALGYYRKLVDENHASNLIWMRITQVNYQLARWPDVLESVKQYQLFEPTLDVSMLSLRLGAEFQLKKWSNASKTLGQLIELEPNKARWWQQLVSIEIRRERSNQALNVLTLSKLQGIPLSKQEVRLLAQLYANQGIPAKAAESLALLDEAKTDIDMIVRQAQLWQQAKQWEASINYWQLAAKRNSKYHWQAAQLLLNQREYALVLKELDKVPNGKLTASMMFAKIQSAYRTEQLNLALRYAEQVNLKEPTPESERWIAYLSKRLDADSSK